MRKEYNKSATPRQEGSTFDKLPPQTQAQIKHLLEINDFRAAKALYDVVAKKAPIDQN